MLTEIRQLLNPLLLIANQAGLAIMDIYERRADLKVRHKADHSLLTLADELAHDILVTQLSRLTPGLPILSEEGHHIDHRQRLQWDSYWLVDPLDGTKEFVDRTSEFSINMALVHANQPLLGVVYIPALQISYYAIHQGGAYKRLACGAAQAIRVRKKPDTTMIAISRRHNPQRLQAMLANLGSYRVLTMGSAWKICQVAEGSADIYPRLGPTSEWDTAAGQCVLEEAGGQLIDLQGLALRYNTKESLLNPGFIAIGDKNFNWLSHLTI